jgi:hypothetical protein
MGWKEERVQPVDTVQQLWYSSNGRTSRLDRQKDPVACQRRSLPRDSKPLSGGICSEAGEPCLLEDRLSLSTGLLAQNMQDRDGFGVGVCRTGRGLVSVVCTGLAPAIVWQFEALDSHMGQRATTNRALALLCPVMQAKSRN